jgi:hypothetical protein
MSADLDRLADAKYVLLTTYRKDGRAVPTAVWAAGDGDELLVWTVNGSGKVKRIRRSGAVTLAACDVRGKPSGESVAGQARMLDAAGTQHTRELIAKKYGILGRLTMFGSRLRRGTEGTVGIAITVGDTV